MSCQSQKAIYSLKELETRDYSCFSPYVALQDARLEPAQHGVLDTVSETRLHQTCRKCSSKRAFKNLKNLKSADRPYFDITGPTVSNPDVWIGCHRREVLYAVFFCCPQKWAGSAPATRSLPAASPAATLTDAIKTCSCSRRSGASPRMMFYKIFRRP